MVVSEAPWVEKPNHLKCGGVALMEDRVLVQMWAQLIHLTQKALAFF